MSSYPVDSNYGKALDILGVQVHPVGVPEVHGYIEKVIAEEKKALVLNVNIHCVNLALHSPWLRDFLNAAQMVFCDGDGVRWGLRILGMNPPPKITYDRWLWQLAELAAEKEYSFYFLGGKPGVAEEAAGKIRERFPAVRFAGTQHGYFEKSGPENERVIEEINAARPDILILGFGMPVQEAWLKANWERVHAHIFLTGGAAFDYAAGRARRAPGWMIRANLEWLFRLYEEPKRLFRRYIYGNPYFMFRVFCEKIRRKLWR